MSTTALVQSTAPSISAETSSDPHALGEAIAQLAAQLHAATYELLVLLRQFDECAGWNTGFLTCAHWLHSTPTRRLRASGTPAWRTGFDLGACREKVRVAKALASLPRISAEMRLGRLSYAKVRALTRVATQDTESTLLDLARAGNAAHVERFVRAWRRVNRAAAAAQTETRHLNRQLATWVDDDGMVVIRGRLAPDVGAVVQRALEAAADRLFHEQRDLPKPEQLVEEVTPAQRRADALGLLAEVALTADLDRGSAGDRYQVVLHAEMPIGVAAGEVCRARQKSTTARSTFPRKRCDAFHATRRSWRYVMTLTARCSTSGGRRAPCRRPSGEPSNRATGPADFQAVRRAGAMHIMSSTGWTAELPASTTWCCCADAITELCTRADSASFATTTAV